MDEDDWVVLGGETEATAGYFADSLADAVPTLEAGVQAAVVALAGPERELGAESLEITVLDRAGGRRSVRRLSDEDVVAILSS